MTDRSPVHFVWWMPLGGITLLLLVYNSAWLKMALPEAHGLKRWVFGFHLEMNFAAWWSAVLLLLGAALFYEIASHQTRPSRRAYLELALLMLALAADEIGSLRERIGGFGGWPALAPFAVLAAALLVDSLSLLWRERESRSVAWLAAAGFLLLAGAAGQELGEHGLSSRWWPRWTDPVFREGTELVAALVILGGAVYRRRGRRWGGPLAAVVPDPTRMWRLVPLIVIGLVAHLVAAWWPEPPQVRAFGSPAAIYPVVVFFLLACYAFWVPRHRPQDSARSPEVRGFWSAVGLLFLLCSVGNMQNLWGFVGKLVPGLGRKFFYDAVPIQAVLILLVWLVGAALWRQRGRRLLWLLPLPLTMVLLVELQHVAAQPLAAGLFAALCAAALIEPRDGAAFEPRG